MLSLCLCHVATIASQFRFSVFHFLAKLSKICEILLLCEKKRMKLSLLYRSVNTSSRRKGNLMALTTVYQFELWLKVRDIPSKLPLPKQGPWNLVWVKQSFELSEVELTEFHCTYFINPLRSKWCRGVISLRSLLFWHSQPLRPNITKTFYIILYVEGLIHFYQLTSLCYSVELVAPTLVAASTPVLTHQVLDLLATVHTEASRLRASSWGKCLPNIRW